MTRLANAPPPMRQTDQTQTPPPNGDDEFKRLMRNRFNDKELKAIEKIDQVTSECRGVMERAADHMARALMMANGIEQLRQLIDRDVMAKILPLMNTRLGFRTDKDPVRDPGKPPYSEPVVKDCFIESLLYGAYPIGNEWNIIAGNLYLTKEFFIRKLGELPGVTDIVASPGVPMVSNGKTVIRYGLAWKKNGISDSLKDAEGKPGRVFEIKTNQYSGADQIVGKADRKAYAAAYRQITGSQITLPDGEADDVVEVNGTGKPRSGGIGDKLNGHVTSATASAAPYRQIAPADDGSQLPESERTQAAQNQISAEEFDRLAREKAQASKSQPAAATAATPSDAVSQTPDISSWPRFVEAVVAAAAKHSIDAATARTGLHRAAMLLQRVGKEETISQGQRQHWLNCVNENTFDFATGKVATAK